jgi:hypothetical protein
MLAIGCNRLLLPVVAASEQRVHVNVLEHTLLLDALAQRPLEGHAGLLHYASRSRVLGHVEGVYAIEVHLLEAVARHCPSRLGAVAFVSVGLADPVAQLGALVGAVADGSHELVAVTQRYRQVYLAVLKLVVEGVDPVRGHAVRVGMRYHPHIRGDVLVSGKPLHFRGVAQREWPEYEAFRFDLDVFTHGRGLSCLVEWRCVGV